MGGDDSAADGDEVTTPTVSVLVSTFRPGGIDVLLAGMRDQTYRDFELILIDRRYFQRHSRVQELATRCGVKLLHVTEHRRNGKWVSFCSAWNTGMALARGDVLIFLQDYAYAPPGWIEAHLDALGSGRRYVLAPYTYAKMPDLEMSNADGVDPRTVGLAKCEETVRLCVQPDTYVEGGLFDEICVFKDGFFDPKWIHQLPLQEHPHIDPRVSQDGPVTIFPWVHVKNESMHRKLAWELNGLDERLERGKGPMDTDWEMRLKNSGTQLWWSNKPWSYCINPRVVFFTQPWGATSDRVEGRWSWDDGKYYVEKRSQEIKEGGSPRAKNPYTMEELAEQLQPWRDGAIPTSRDVSDLEYWGRDIWPDSD